MDITLLYPEMGYSRVYSLIEVSNDVFDDFITIGLYSNERKTKVCCGTDS